MPSKSRILSGAAKRKTKHVKKCQTEASKDVEKAVYFTKHGAVMPQAVYRYRRSR